MAHIRVSALTATHRTVCLTTCNLRTAFSKSSVLLSTSVLQYTLWAGVSCQNTHVLLQTMRNKLKISGHYSLT